MKKLLFSLFAVCALMPSSGAHAEVEFDSDVLFPTWESQDRPNSAEVKKVRIPGTIGRNKDLTDEATGEKSDKMLMQMLPRMVDVIMRVVAAIAFGVVVFGGIRFIYSGDSEEELTASKMTIQYAFLGVLFIVLSYSIMKSIYIFFTDSGEKDFDLASSATEMNDLANEIEELLAKAEELEAEAEELRAEADAAEDRAKQFKEAAGAVGSLKSQDEKLDEAITALEGSVASEDKRIATIEGDLRRTKTEADSLEAELKKGLLSREERKKIQDRLKELKEKKKSLEKAKEEAEKRKKETEKQIKALRTLKDQGDKADEKAVDDALGAAAQTIKADAAAATNEAERKVKQAEEDLRKAKEAKTRSQAMVDAIEAMKGGGKPDPKIAPTVAAELNELAQFYEKDIDTMEDVVKLMAKGEKSGILTGAEKGTVLDLLNEELQRLETRKAEFEAKGISVTELKEEIDAIKAHKAALEKAAPTTGDYAKAKAYFEALVKSRKEKAKKIKAMAEAMTTDPSPAQLQEAALLLEEHGVAQEARDKAANADAEIEKAKANLDQAKIEAEEAQEREEEVKAEATSLTTKPDPKAVANALESLATERGKDAEYKGPPSLEEIRSLAGRIRDGSYSDADLKNAKKWLNEGAKEQKAIAKEKRAEAKEKEAEADKVREEADKVQGKLCANKQVLGDSINQLPGSIPGQDALGQFPGAEGLSGGLPGGGSLGLDDKIGGLKGSGSGLLEGAKSKAGGAAGAAKSKIPAKPKLPGGANIFNASDLSAQSIGGAVGGAASKASGAVSGAKDGLVGKANGLLGGAKDKAAGALGGLTGGLPGGLGELGGKLPGPPAVGLSPATKKHLKNCDDKNHSFKKKKKDKKKKDDGKGKDKEKEADETIGGVSMNALKKEVAKLKKYPDGDVVFSWKEKLIGKQEYLYFVRPGMGFNSKIKSIIRPFKNSEADQVLEKAMEFYLAGLNIAPGTTIGRKELEPYIKELKKYPDKEIRFEWKEPLIGKNKVLYFIRPGLGNNVPMKDIIMPEDPIEAQRILNLARKIYLENLEIAPGQETNPEILLATMYEVKLDKLKNDKDPNLVSFIWKKPFFAKKEALYFQCPGFCNNEYLKTISKPENEGRANDILGIAKDVYINRYLKGDAPKAADPKK